MGYQVLSHRSVLVSLPTFRESPCSLRLARWDRGISAAQRSIHTLPYPFRESPSSHVGFMEYQLLNRSILFLWAIPRITFQVARPVIPVDRLAAPLDCWLRCFVCSLSQSHFTAANISSTVPGGGSKDSSMNSLSPVPLHSCRHLIYRSKG